MLMLEATTRRCTGRLASASSSTAVPTPLMFVGREIGSVPSGLKVGARFRELKEPHPLRAAYERGDDLHALTARQVLGIDDVTKEHRQLAKAVNFGLLYGMGAQTLRQHAAQNYGVDLRKIRWLQAGVNEPGRANRGLCSAAQVPSCAGLPMPLRPCRRHRRLPAPGSTSGCTR